MTEDNTRIAVKHETMIAKFRDGEDEPYQIVASWVWTDPDGTEITDQDRIARLEKAAE